METKGSSAIYSAVSKLVGTIETHVRNESKTNNIKEMSLLREWCCSEHPVVSVTACQGIVFLVQNSCLPISETISSLIASSEISSAKSVTGVTNAVVNLMLLKLKAELSEQQVYTCPYSARSHPVHPLVAILKHRPHVWRDVFNHVDSICNHSDKRISDNSLKLLTPVFQYVLQDENNLPEACRHHVWSLLVNSFLDHSVVLDLLISFLVWESSRVLELNSCLTIVCEAVTKKQDNNLALVMPLLVCVVVHRLLDTAYNPQPALLLLKKLSTSAVNTHSTVLILLSHTITICPAVFLHNLLEYCLWLLQQGHCTQDATWMCVSAMLPWLVVNAAQMQKALHTATKIISLAKTTTANPCLMSPLVNNTLFPLVVGADPRIITAVHLAKLSENLSNDYNEIEHWLDNRDSEMFALLYLYVSSLLIGRPTKSVKLSALNFLVKCPSKFAANNSTVFLYQLARDREPDLQLALLNALPSTAVDKENIAVVMSTIEALRQSQDKVLRLLAVQLSVKLWLVQERCFHVVMEVLSQNVHTTAEDEAAEFNTVEAAVCKQICALRPEKHGKELVMKISDLLSHSGGPQGTLASVLALDALVPLCKETVIDVHSIWKHLAPRMCKDKRPDVLSSFCKLVSLTATTTSSATDAADTLACVVRWLWQTVVSSPHAVVTQSALEALAKFKPEQMCLKSLPESYRRGLKIPPELAKTPAEAARKPEDVLTYIPGTCWVQMLQQVRVEARDAAVRTVAAWLSMELAAYRSGKYNLSRGEPPDYKQLQVYSVCRGLYDFVRCTPSTAADSDITTLKLCVAVACQPLPKPLPPLNWTFLGDFLRSGDVELTSGVVSLLAKQSQISPSARNVLEEYMSTNLSCDKVELLYSLLTDLCRGIPPNSLRPFLDKTLRPAFDNDDEKTLRMILQCIKSTLHNQKIHEANLVLLSQQVQALWAVMDSKHVLLQEFLACASELSTCYVETMSSISLMWELSTENVEKAIKFRAYMALVPDTPAPLIWLNEIIDVATTNITWQVAVMQVVGDVLSRLHNHPTAWEWLQELLGQIYKAASTHQPGLDFLLSVFIITVDWISGYALLGLGLGSTVDTDFNCLRFPQAVVQLVKHHGDSKQMAEWLKFLLLQTDFNPGYVSMFQLAANNVSLL